MGPRSAAVDLAEEVVVDVSDPLVRDHRRATVSALERSSLALERCAGWGRRLGQILSDGGRLLVCGNGGSAAEAQHLTAEIVGRFRDDRPAYSAISLHAETSSLTAIVNDYGIPEMFARQVDAHGRPGDVLMMLTTSGRSVNLLHAAERAKARGMQTWALTGPAPNPLSRCAAETASVPSTLISAIQEVQLVAVHVLCSAFDAVVTAGMRQDPRTPV